MSEEGGARPDTLSFFAGRCRFAHPTRRRADGRRAAMGQPWASHNVSWHNTADERWAMWADRGTGALKWDSGAPATAPPPHVCWETVIHSLNEILFF